MRMGSPAHPSVRGISFRARRGSSSVLSILSVLSLLLLTGPWAVHAAAPAPRPNIVFLLADQWRAQAFGFAGDPNVQTPHLDRLQREALHFPNAISGVPVCCPYRASLLTGRRPLSHGVFMNDVPLAPETVTLAKVLKTAGYDTAYIGKWHLDGHGRSAFIPPERRQGFDYWKVLECTHDYSNSAYYADAPAKLKWDGYDAFAQTRDAQDYLRTRRSDPRPFLLLLAWGPPHDPYQTAPAEYRALYRPEKLVPRPNIPATNELASRRMLAGYYAHCTALDTCVGQIRGTLQELGLEQNTLLVFTSDHGDLLGSHGQRNKQQPYEESIRVPLLLRWPAGLGVAPSRLDALITAEDLMPTLLGLSRVKSPKGLEGLDFSRYLRGGRNPNNDVVLLSCVAPFGQWPRRSGGREYRGLRTPRYTYVRDLRGPWLLFDNETDPYQLTNLAGRPEHARLQARLEAALRRKLRQTHDQFLPGDAYLKKWGYQVDATGTVPYKN